MSKRGCITLTNRHFTRAQTAAGGLGRVLSVSSEIQPGVSSLCSAVATEAGPPYTPAETHTETFISHP